MEDNKDIEAPSASKAFIPRSAWQRASGGAVVDRRRQGYGFASRLSDEKSLPHRPLIVKRLSRHKRREHIALADSRDEKRNRLQKTRYIPTFWSRIKKTTLSFAKKIVFLKRHKNVDHIVTVQPRTVIFFAVCAKKFTKSSYIALFPGLFSWNGIKMRRKL